MWDRWQKGESLHQIAQLFDRHHTSVRRILAESGGIRPAPRKRSCRSLTLAEREEISRGLASARSLRAIALQLGRAPSTISREVNRNGGMAHYRASQADQAAWDRAHRPKTCKLVANRALARVVARKPGEHGRCAARAITHRKRQTTAGSPTQCQSVNGRPLWRIAPYPGTGKATWYSAAITARSPPWSNVTHAT